MRAPGSTPSAPPTRSAGRSGSANRFDPSDLWWFCYALPPNLAAQCFAACQGSDYGIIPREDEPASSISSVVYGCEIVQRAEYWEDDVDPKRPETSLNRQFDRAIKEKNVSKADMNALYEWSEDVIGGTTEAPRASGTGQFEHSCWVDDPCPGLEYFYPDFAPYFGADGLGMVWVYLEVDEPAGLTDEADAADAEPDNDRHYGQERWDLISRCKYIYPVSALHFFACYQIVRASGDETADYWLIRYWVGVIHHPSLFANLKSEGVSRSNAFFSAEAFEEGQDMLPHSYSDLDELLAGATCGIDCDPVLAQYYMSSVDRVDVTIQYHGATESDPARDHYVKYWRENTRMYPRGGNETGAALNPEEFDPAAGFYERLFLVDDSPYWGDVAVQETAGTARSFIGNMLRGEVRVTAAKAEAWSDKKAAQKGFRCLFGRDVVVEFAVTYMPLYDDGLSEPRTAVVRRVLNPTDLEDASAFAAAGIELAYRDKYTEFLYQPWDYDLIRQDLA